MLEEARTNSIRNNTMVGAVVPGTLPTNWSMSSGGGMTATVVSTGTENGINYIDINLAGTSTGSPTYFGFNFENYVAALPNSIWTNSFYMKLISGVLPGGVTIINALSNYNLALTNLGVFVTSAAIIPTSAALNTQRNIVTTLSTSFTDPTTAYIRPYFQFAIPLSTVMNITIRIGMPQFELGGYASSVIPTSNAIVTRAVESNLVDYDYLDSRISLSRASSATYFDSSGILQTASNNKPRYDYNPSTLAKRGLLIEEARTNSIRNNTMKGIAIGTPGTVPANWVGTGLNSNGLTRTLIGIGIENGITYLDMRVAGTPTTSTYIGITPDQLIAGLIAQTWTGSFWSKLVAGSFTNTNVNIEIRESNSSQVLQANTLTPISLSSALTRFTQTRTLTGVTTAFVSMNIVFQTTTSLPIDFTIRIGLPQLELGAFATSVILTSSAAATRVIEMADVNDISSFYNPIAGALYAKYTPLATGKICGAVCFSDGTLNNRMIIRAMNASNQTAFIGVDSGITSWGTTINSATTGTTKSIFAYQLNDIAFTRNGSSALTDSIATIPIVTKLRLGNDGDGSFPLCGYLCQVTYYPVRLTNAELQTITT